MLKKNLKSGIIELRIKTLKGDECQLLKEITISDRSKSSETPGPPYRKRDEPPTREIYSFNPHYPCAHSPDHPVFSVSDFPVIVDKTLPLSQYNLIRHKFKTSDLVECIITAYTATTCLFLDSVDKCSKHEFINTAIEVFSDCSELSIQRIFPSLKRWYGGLLIWSVSEGLICQPTIDEILLLVQNFRSELRNPYCLTLYHRDYKVVTMNDIRESLSPPNKAKLWEWVTDQIESLEID